MNGYWAGSYTGDNVGRMVIEIDDRGDHFEGCAYAYEKYNSLANTFAIIKTIGKGNKTHIKAPLIPLHPQTGEPTDWQSIAHLYPKDVIVPTDADVEIEWDNQHLSIRWQSNIGTTGSAYLPRGEARQPSAYAPLPIKTWREFRDYVAGLDGHRFIFRGQDKPLRLRTPFHRTGRGDMRRYFLEDIPTLDRHLSAQIRHVFNLKESQGKRSIPSFDPAPRVSDASP